MKSDTQNKSPTHFKVPRRVPCKKIYADLLRPDFRVILSTQHFEVKFQNFWLWQVNLWHKLEKYARMQCLHKAIVK